MMLMKNKVLNCSLTARKLIKLFKECQVSVSEKKMRILFKSPIIQMLFGNWVCSGEYGEMLRNHETLNSSVEKAQRILTFYLNKK